VEEIIRSTGFYRAKTKSLLGCARALVADHGGEVPRSMAAMVELPGVGRKTASVVLGHVYDIAEGIAVDTHVLRVSNRLGIARGDDPIEVERQLMAIVPKERWTRTTDLLIFHGRKICIARRPLCGQCPVFALCRWPPRQAFAMGKPPRAKGAPGRAARRRRKPPARAPKGLTRTRRVG
jgi:endonuclease-3